MARGETAGQQQARGEASKLSGTADRLRGTLVPGYEDLARGTGYSDVEKAGITSATMGGLGGTFDALRQSAANRVARTRNSAGYAEQEDELARSQGREAAGLGGDLTKSFADEAERRRETGLAGLAHMYGVDEETMARLIGIGAPNQGSGALGAGIGAGGSIIAAGIIA